MLERTDQLELANLPTLRCATKTDSAERPDPNIAKELLQSRPRGSAGVFDGKSPLTTNAWLAPRQPTGSLQLEHGPVTLSLRLKAKPHGEGVSAMAHPSRGC